MRRPVALLLVVAALAFVPGLAGSQGGFAGSVGDVAVTVRAYAPLAPAEAIVYGPGQSGEVVVFLATTSNGTHRAEIAFSSDPAVVRYESATATADAFNATEPPAGRYVHAAFAIADDAEPGPFRFLAAVTVYVQNATAAPEDANATNASTGGAEWTLQGERTFEVAGRVPTPAPGPSGLPVSPLVAAVAIGILVLGGGAVLLRRRRPRVKPRSRALREVAAETAAPEAQAKVAVEEAARVKDREHSILEAKRADILRSIELSRGRLSRGEITEHVFNQIEARKRQALEAVDAEIRQKGG
ncbi:MAG: hypothetical protein ACT4PT_13100 [Methanobacteriota archaeon]